MRRILLFAVLLTVTAVPRLSFAQPAVNSEIAPTGKLRVAMNASTAVLLTRTPDGKVIGGVAVDVGKFIAEKLGVPFELVPHSGSDTYSKSFGKGEWDIGFATRTPLVADKAEFVVDVVLSDYVFVAAPGREFADAAQVDRPGVKVGTGQTSASYQFLSRTLKSAELVGIPRGTSGIDALRTGKADVWATGAGNVQQLIDRLPGAKIVPGAFTSDRHMVTLPKGKSSAAQSKIAEIVKEAKKSGVVRKAIEQLGVKGVRAAPD
jgi:polar amino acid transport system substrate-binding protein